jgi:hypothetical protein
MSIDPLTVRTVPADEQWDETLDALARQAVRGMAARGLLTDGAEGAARFHVRGFGRRLLNPVLDQIRAEVQAGYREASDLRGEAERLRTEVAALRRARRRWVWAGILFGVVWMTLIGGLGWVLLLGPGASPAATVEAVNQTVLDASWEPLPAVPPVGAP